MTRTRWVISILGGIVVAATLAIDSIAGSPSASDRDDRSGQRQPASSALRAVQIAVGESFACARMNDASIQCWGDDFHAQLGVPGRDSALPRHVPCVHDVAHLELGQGHACALLRDETIACWGSTTSGQLGNGVFTMAGGQSEASSVLHLHGVRAIAMGDSHGCALLADGVVACWGENFRGELGLGASGLGTGRAVAVPVPRLRGARGIHAGVMHSCITLPDGTARCWGSNEGSQLGLGNGPSESVPTPTEVRGLSDVADIALGGHHSCARSSDGTVRCWGSNAYGQLGVVSTAFAPSPIEVPLLRDVVEIDAGFDHTCARSTDGSVRCWGSNLRGQLGDGTTVHHTEPTTIPDLADVVQLALGYESSCALLRSGVVRCWGSNLSGQLGDGTRSSRTSPVETRLLARVSPAAQRCPAPGAGPTDRTLPERTLPARSGPALVDVCTGETHTCVLAEDDSIRCWGRGERGQVGYGLMSRYALNTPPAVPVLSGASRIACGSEHTCAQMRDGSVQCWGENKNGQLGDGSTTARAHPAPVSGLSNVTALALGRTHSCALQSDGGVVCWGGNAKGQIGDGSTSDRVAPTAVTGVANVAQIVTGDSLSCARLRDGSVSCWGENNASMLGSDLGESVPTPTRIPGLTGTLQITISGNHGCVLGPDAKISCWGENYSGQLGRSERETLPNSTPAPVQGIDRVAAVSCADRYTCVRKTDGSVFCWGDTDMGQSGRTDSRENRRPTRIAIRGGATRLTTGDSHACVLTTSRQLTCWGDANDGRLGSGPVSAASGPVSPTW